MPKIGYPFTILPPFTPLSGEQHRNYDVDSLFTLNTPKHCGQVMVQAHTQNIRYTMDGTNPTTTSGFILTSGNDPLILPITEKTTLKFISETAGAILEIAFGE